MAEQNIKINVKTETGYDTLYPQTKGAIVNFNKSGSNLRATDVDSAIKEVNKKTDEAKLNANNANNNANGRIEKNKILETLNEVNLTNQKGFVPDAMIIKDFTNQFLSSNIKTYIPQFQTPSREVNCVYSYRYGNYLKIGCLVYVNISMKGWITESGEYARVSLPYSGSSKVHAQSIVLSEYHNMFSSPAYSAQIWPASKQIQIQGTDGSSNLQWRYSNPQSDDGGYIRISGFYLTDE